MCEKSIERLMTTEHTRRIVRGPPGGAMKIGCVYTVERGATGDKPLPYAMDIPFGMGIIATVLKEAHHDVTLMVFSPRSHYAEIISRYIETERPRLFCLTAVTTQFAFAREIARLVKQADPSIFVIL